MSAAKTLLIWRVGGIGDLIWCTAALPVLRRQGFIIDFCTDAGGREVLAHNPHVRRLIPFEEQRTPDGQELQDPENRQQLMPRAVEAWFNDLAKDYDGAVCLTWSVESVALWKQRDHPLEYNLPLAERQTDLHYTDEIVRRLAMPWLGGLLPQLFPSRAERRWLDSLRLQHVSKKQRMLLWHAAGSAYNKALPQANYYISGLLKEIPELVIYLCGDGGVEQFIGAGKILDVVRDRCVPVYKTWSLRQQLLATSIADCVVGPESSIVNAAACWDSPKVIFFSHSRHENLSLYWWNAYPIYPTDRCDCAPCYKLISGEPESCRAYEADLDWAAAAGQHERADNGPRTTPACQESAGRDQGPEVSGQVSAVGGQGRGRAVGAKCCVHLDHGRVFQTIGSILRGRKDRTCPACGRQKNRILQDGVYICACGARFGMPAAPQRTFPEPEPMTCPVCHVGTYERVPAVGKPGWALCRCGVIFQDVRHVDHSVYDEAYTKKYDSPEPRKLIRAVGERWLPRIEELMRERGMGNAECGMAERPRLLEIGYCLPEVLMLACERGWDVAGVELNPASPNGDFPRFIGDFETIPTSDLGPETWDVVFSNHVFEHFKEPVKALEKMLQLVRPGGLILIATPDAENAHVEDHLHRKEHHVIWSAPALAAQAMKAGLEVTEVEKHDGPECGFISWFDFHMLLRRPAAGPRASEQAGKLENSEACQPASLPAGAERP
ncbi:MAG: methyltransferase domain-containing protein [Candidatus Methylomirabilota bacterium]|jgi:ADP-heptose:LPS heptosyltransferase